MANSLNRQKQKGNTKVKENGLVLILFSIYLFVPILPDFFGLKTAFSPYAIFIFFVGLVGVLLGKKVI